ncbi:phosphatase PAP2 family protein [Streptomyces sp. NPDC048362]|uniref:phosphatase PAP2 family protein n=1 Tax=Streptomyces sp. NPDC048362 TaxID=3365539 RepID=UPI00372221CD
MAWHGGWRGRKTAAAGLGALAVAQLVSNGLCKQLADRPRPPKDWIPHDEAADRPDSSSFPSGHTAAAVAFVVAPTWPAAGALCAVPAGLVALERVQTGAHYPSDVAAGAAIGLASAWLTRRAPALLLHHGRSPRPRSSGGDSGRNRPNSIPAHVGLAGRRQACGENGDVVGVVGGQAGEEFVAEGVQGLASQGGGVLA